jgi:hypothetical protein
LLVSFFLLLPCCSRSHFLKLPHVLWDVLRLPVLDSVLSLGKPTLVANAGAQVEREAVARALRAVKVRLGTRATNMLLCSGHQMLV